MDYLIYKNYFGSVEFDQKAHCLKGRVQGLREESLNYKGQSLDELERNFQNAVDNYIESCYQKKETPKKSYGGPLNIRLGPDLHGRAAYVAEQLGITINAFIKEAVARYLDRYDSI